MKNLKTPVEKEELLKLRAGDEVLFTGALYTARDQAHKRLAEAIRKGKKLPIDLKTAVIYYTGPTPPTSGRPVGSCGPTTASRMDGFTPLLVEHGLRAMIGKGGRSEEVRKCLAKNKAVYFSSYGGCGALLAETVKKKKLVAYGDLGTEAIWKLEVEDFPAVVAIDTTGKNVFGG